MLGCLFLLLLGAIIAAYMGDPSGMKGIIVFSIAIVLVLIFKMKRWLSEPSAAAPSAPAPPFTGTATFQNCPYCHCNRVGVAIYRCRDCSKVYCRVCGGGSCSTAGYDQLGTIAPR
jgi:hypothetical protein